MKIFLGIPSPEFKINGMGRIHRFRTVNFVNHYGDFFLLDGVGIQGLANTKICDRTKRLIEYWMSSRVDKYTLTFSRWWTSGEQEAGRKQNYILLTGHQNFAIPIQAQNKLLIVNLFRWARERPYLKSELVLDEKPWKLIPKRQIHWSSLKKYNVPLKNSRIECFGPWLHEFWSGTTFGELAPAEKRRT